MIILDSNLLFGATIYRVAQKVSHYRQSPFSRIKNRKPG